MSSVCHRPQCNIGPGISPVTISTMDDSRKRPGSPGLASSTRRRRANDEINAHSSMLVAMTGTVVVVASVTSSITHTMLASDTRRSINERSRRLNWEDHCEDLDERGPDCFRRQYRPDASADLRKNLQIYCVSSLYATAVSSHFT